MVRDERTNRRDAERVSLAVKLAFAQCSRSAGMRYLTNWEQGKRLGLIGEIDNFNILCGRIFDATTYGCLSTFLYKSQTNRRNNRIEEKDPP